MTATNLTGTNSTGTRKVFVPNNHLMARLAGSRDEHLRRIEASFPDTRIHVRGNEITLEGPSADQATKLFEELIVLLEAGITLDDAGLGRSIDMVRADERPSKVLSTEAMRSSKGKSIKAKTSGQKRYVDAINDNIITVGIGPAGSGKSYLAVALAVHALVTKQVTRIILTRPAVEAGEKLGFLPGDLMAKIDPYLRPLYDALYDMMDMERVNRLIERGDIEIAPLAFMRGRTLNDSFVILDEAQNATAEQMKMFLTRLGFHSKVVVTGDITQVDLPSDRVSGLVEVKDILRDIDGIQIVYFNEKDVVRHRLVQDIIKAYDRHQAPSDEKLPRPQSSRPPSRKPSTSSHPSNNPWGQPH
jgi:phosphate starvation-inducible protein PhoH and related proteins